MTSTKTTTYSVRAEVPSKASPKGYETVYFLLEATDKKDASYKAVTEMRERYGSADWTLTGLGRIIRVTAVNAPKSRGFNVHVVKRDGTRVQGRLRGWDQAADGPVISVFDGKTHSGLVLSHTELVPGDEVELVYGV